MKNIIQMDSSYISSDLWNGAGEDNEKNKSSQRSSVKADQRNRNSPLGAFTLNTLKISLKLTCDLIKSSTREVWIKSVSHLEKFQNRTAGLRFGDMNTVDQGINIDKAESCWVLIVRNETQFRVFIGDGREDESQALVCGGVWGRMLTERTKERKKEAGGDTTKGGPLGFLCKF